MACRPARSHWATRTTASARRRLACWPSAWGCGPTNTRSPSRAASDAPRWLEPYTDVALRKLARAGHSRVDVICPGFVADCLETLEEIAIEGRDTFLAAGGKDFHAIACLNDHPAWIDALAKLAIRHLQGWPAHGGRERRSATQPRARPGGRRAPLSGPIAPGSATDNIPDDGLDAPRQVAVGGAAVQDANLGRARRGARARHGQWPTRETRARVACRRPA